MGQQAAAIQPHVFGDGSYAGAGSGGPRAWKS
jgi:hypothetical protein